MRGALLRLEALLGESAKSSSVGRARWVQQERRGGGVTIGRRVVVVMAGRREEMRF